MSRLREKVKKYFSGRLALTQVVAGCGAFVGRSAAVYLCDGQAVWYIVLASMLGSFTGYIATYVLGYWLAFRRDYKASGRSMFLDIFRLQLVEQLPNFGTVAASGLTQGALIGGTGLPPVLAVNLGSWFGLHKIVNFVAMAASNSLKRAWVDGSWSPLAGLKILVRRAMRAPRGVSAGSPSPVYQSEKAPTTAKQDVGGVRDIPSEAPL